MGEVSEYDGSAKIDYAFVRNSPHAMIHGILPVQAYLHHATNIQEATLNPSVPARWFLCNIGGVYFVNRNQMKQTL